MIGLVKAALEKSIGYGMLTWKELEELLVETETLNNQPLQYMEDDIQLQWGLRRHCSLNINKANGSDQLPAVVLKEFVSSLALSIL